MILTIFKMNIIATVCLFSIRNPIQFTSVFWRLCLSFPRMHPYDIGIA